MKTLRFAICSLALGMLLAAGSATAAERVDVNSADAAALGGSPISASRSCRRCVPASRQPRFVMNAFQISMSSSLGLRPFLKAHSSNASSLPPLSVSPSSASYEIPRNRQQRASKVPCAAGPRIVG